MEEIRCSVCGTVVNPGDTFCQNCGSPVETTPAASPEPASAPEQPDTTVLSGNPFSTGSDGTQTSQQSSSTGYQSVNSGETNTYQQAPSGMDTNAQGTYGTYNTTYNVNNYTQAAPEPKQSKALGIVGLVLGILGLLTSCCYGGLLFGLIGLILSIVYLAKKGSKGIGITGAVISGIALIASIIWLSIAISTGAGIFDELQQFNDEYGSGTNSSTEDPWNYTVDNNDYTDPDFWNYTEDDNDYTDPATSSNVTGTNQILVNGTDLYTLPASLNSLGLSVNSDADSDVVEDIEQNGLYAGDYKFVVLDSNNGYSFWGFIENTGEDTIYSIDDCQVTGINVDNYSSWCTAWSAEVYGGVTLNMTRSEVENLIGYPDTTDSDGFAVYGSYTDSEVLRLEYDEYDYVIAVDITIYN